MFEDFFCDRLAKLRLEKGVSAREMSLSLGQSACYINKIENHNTLPSLNVFFYICEYFDISPKDFFDEKKTNPSLINEINNELKNLDENQLNCIFNLIKSICKHK